MTALLEKSTSSEKAHGFEITSEDLGEIKDAAKTFTLEETWRKAQHILRIHEHDPNFPHPIIDKLKAFLQNDDILRNPDTHESLIQEVKLQLAVITYNSPYASVRAVVSNHDDPDTPSSTIRAWAIGIFFVIVVASTNQIFSIRQPSITLGGHSAQVLSYPLGRAAARWLPDRNITILGKRLSLNPGPFSKKEHMLITIMASVGSLIPYTSYIVWTQYLSQYFNQPYAGSFSYQILIGLATNMIGYGLAGVARRFLVWPSYCVWPTSLITVAINSAFHDEGNAPVRGPFGKVFTISRLRLFIYAFGVMFFYFWFPNTIFQALSIFNWISWIAPDNVRLNSVVGFNNGVGLNPIPTFDWLNILHSGVDPLMIPLFSTINKFAGSLISMLLILTMWYRNAFNTAYLPINSNRLYDHASKLYNVSRIVDADGLFVAAKYERYSPAFLAAGNITNFLAFFMIYTATLTYALLYHSHEIKLGFLDLWRSLRTAEKDLGRYQDVHNRLMASYREVPEWWFFGILLFSIACGVTGVAGWPTYTSPAVVFYGIVLCLVFVVPIGIIKAMTGIEVSLAVLAEFMGGSLFPGNALAMNYMKAYGFVTCSHAISFAHDLKLAHYVKIPPRQTFSAQIVATVVSTLICTALLNFQMNNIPDVCTPEAPFRFTCPNVNSFFTSAVIWGTIGPRKVFGAGGAYSLTLLGFPAGILIVLGCAYARRRFSAVSWLRQVHPVVILSGGAIWAPYNISYIWPAVPVAWLSWVYIKTRWSAFWAKYAFVFAAALTTGVAISGLVIFVIFQSHGVKFNWWGNRVSYQGCEALGDPCRLLRVKDGETFGPPQGEFS
ncbi:OPT oligopeptide transporter protein-domain-containing protein [Cercophora scortea]|uniref:OPT oligopeptide transporter protein-domain-containing protein n=1 Tax=Cercophora scortea TaxID=314031 RepID=A0AAE0IDW8_9PEZI|nr:OPT oligopeptide transporter protein-domain-containing protein [Cercophora scortea]